MSDIVERTKADQARIDRISEILHKHQFDWSNSGTRCIGSGCDWRGGYRPQHHEHVAELIDAALYPCIETAEQLEALPDGAVVEVVKGVPEVKWDGCWYAMTSDAFEPDLPACVLYTPTGETRITPTRE
ncbi:hypothetical protein BI081_gp051 [Mycobacterium phage Tonenili]|uniref:Uncharacterized protein n=1 Tax=Mycobacterium phage Tonenili TaxID=1891703 RepID=A0A1C9EH27_9CAUD|nr:hypothetical protein BI081_gp051 [Mycobacterium phage Tonenili]AON96802.1 hypothetical protein SEA_TONENILI_51 [Mycobacterium phage Tonenili]